MHKKNQSLEQQQQEQQRKQEEQLLQALSGKIDANSCGSDEEEIDKKMSGPNRPSI